MSWKIVVSIILPLIFSLMGCEGGKSISSKYGKPKIIISVSYALNYLEARGAPFLILDNAGNIYVAEGDFAVRKFTPKGKLLLKIVPRRKLAIVPEADSNEVKYSTYRIWGCCVDERENIYMGVSKTLVSESYKPLSASIEIQKFDRQGKFLGRIHPLTEKQALGVIGNPILYFSHNNLAYKRGSIITSCISQSSLTVQILNREGELKKVKTFSLSKEEYPTAWVVHGNDVYLIFLDRKKESLKMVDIFTQKTTLSESWKSLRLTGVCLGMDREHSLYFAGTKSDAPKSKTIYLAKITRRGKNFLIPLSSSPKDTILESGLVRANGDIYILWSKISKIRARGHFFATECMNQ
ncbi:MAG: hypothetical protein AB1466_05420 [Actinomycetota bacterium]